jgi:hypothetical protein
MPLSACSDSESQPRPTRPARPGDYCCAIRKEHDMNKRQWLSVWGFAIGAAASPQGSAQTMQAPRDEVTVRTSPDAGDRGPGSAGTECSWMAVRQAGFASRTFPFQNRDAG